MSGKKILIDQPHLFRVAPYPGNLDLTIDVIQSATNHGRWGTPYLTISETITTLYDRPSIEQLAWSLQRAGKALQNMRRYIGRPVE